jgi:monovalent cation/hydrogen antiporter
MGQDEIVVVGLLVAVAALSALARRLSLPYPIVLVLGGALLGFVPGLPHVRLDPEVVLLVFLPPLLYGSSIFANVNDFRGDLRWLTLNTVGLVLVTMAAVAWVAHALIPGLPWAAAFVLGAIVSPTDPLAAATIMRRLGVPRRLVSAVEGEGLCNDATALVAYRVAVAAVVAGSFSLAQAGLRFVLGAAGGVAIGLVVGWVVAELRQRTTDTQISVTISLLTGYAAFVPADAVGASGVLAAVTAGLYMGIRAPRILPVGARLQGGFVWDIVDFLVNAISTNWPGPAAGLPSGDRRVDRGDPDPLGPAGPSGAGSGQLSAGRQGFRPGAGRGAVAPARLARGMELHRAAHRCIATTASNLALRISAGVTVASSSQLGFPA